MRIRTMLAGLMVDLTVSVAWAAQTGSVRAIDLRGFDLGDVDVIMTGDLAVLVVEENLTQRGYDGTMKTQVLTTNVFERVGNEWFMVMHHGSPVMEPPGSEPQLQ